jgi:hypothetical protein
MTIDDNQLMPIQPQSCRAGRGHYHLRSTADAPPRYLVCYDYSSQGQHYYALCSPDLVGWSDAPPKIDFPAGLRHGSFLQITLAQYDRLAALAHSPAQPTSQVEAK